MVKTASIVALVISTAPGSPRRRAARCLVRGSQTVSTAVGDADRQVDVEDPVPVDGLREDAAGQQPTAPPLTRRMRRPIALASRAARGTCDDMLRITAEVTRRDPLQEPGADEHHCACASPQ